jgi:hypothetical protein
VNAVTIVLLAFLLLIILLLLINCSFTIRSKNFDGALQFRIGIFKLDFDQKERKKKKIKKKKGEDQPEVKEEPERDLQSFLSLLAKFDELLKKYGEWISKHLHVEIFTLNVRVGSGDAALTAISYGVLSAVLYPLIALIKSHFKIEKESIAIDADFASNKLDYFFETRFSLKVYEMIAIIMVIIIQNQKIKQHTA